jgi:hypothetical protein
MRSPQAKLRWLVVGIFLVIPYHILRSDELPRLVDTNAEADIVFGPAAPARIYSSWQAAKWGLDFLVAWSRAADRDVLFGYKISKLSDVQLANLFKHERRAQGRLAVVNVLTSGPLAVLGPDRAYSAAPVVYVDDDAGSPAEMSNAFSPEFLENVVSGAVAIAALKGSGVQVSKLKGLQEIFNAKGAEVTYIASTIPLKGVTIDQYFMVPKSAWTVPENNPQLIWGMKLPNSAQR